MRGGFSKGKVNHKIYFNTLTGFLIGAKSSGFKVARLQQPWIRTDVDQWKYMSLVSESGFCIDFMFQSRENVIDFLTTVTAVANSNKNTKFFGLSSHRAIKMLLVKTKLRKMASLNKTSITGLFMRAMFLRASETLPQGTFLEKKQKFSDLNALFCKCKTFKVNLTEADTRIHEDLTK